MKSHDQSLVSSGKPMRSPESPGSPGKWFWSTSSRSSSVPSASALRHLLFTSCRERRQTWAEERRMNAETFGLPLRHGRGRGGYRGRGGMGFRGGRGRSASRGSFGPPQGGGGFRGGYRGNQAGREFADLSAYRVSPLVTWFTCLMFTCLHVYHHHHHVYNHH